MITLYSYNLAYHNINYPLGIDDDVTTQYLSVEVLDGAEAVQEAYRLANFRAVNSAGAREGFRLVPLQDTR